MIMGLSDDSDVVDASIVFTIAGVLFIIYYSLLLVEFSPFWWDYHKANRQWYSVDYWKAWDLPQEAMPTSDRPLSTVLVEISQEVLVLFAYSVLQFFELTAEPKHDFDMEDGELIPEDDEEPDSKELPSNQALIGFLCLWSCRGLVILGGMQVNFRATAVAVMCLAAVRFTSAMLMRGKCAAYIFPRYKTNNSLTRYWQIDAKISRSVIRKEIADSENDCFEIKAEDVYQDFRLQPFTVKFYAVFQGLLLSLYIWGIYENGRPDFGDHRSYAYYWLGLVLQFFYFFLKRKQQSGGPDMDGYWKMMFVLADDGFCLEHNELDPNPLDLNEYRGELWTRYMLSELINQVGLILIRLLLPVQLASTGGLTDVVLNAVAAFFIIEFDDLGEYQVFNAKLCREVKGDEENPTMGSTNDASNDDQHAQWSENTEGVSVDQATPLRFVVPVKSDLQTNIRPTLVIECPRNLISSDACFRVHENKLTKELDDDRNESECSSTRYIDFCITNAAEETDGLLRKSMTLNGDT